MAINTAAKRVSTQNLLIGHRVLMPDGSITQNDRQATTLSYGGILATTATLGGGYVANDFLFLNRKLKR